MKATMLTYGQKMELELMDRVTKKAREAVIQEVREEIKKEITQDVARQAQRDFLLGQLTQRFGTLPGDIMERVGQAETYELEHWAGRILDATSLQDVFTEQHG
jgi:hypothetical protein